MREFIAYQIMNAAKVVNGEITNLTAGQAKYRAYFVTLPYYRMYKADVDAILTLENCAACIVTA